MLGYTLETRCLVMGVNLGIFYCWSWCVRDVLTWPAVMCGEAMPTTGVSHNHMGHGGGMEPDKSC